MQSRRMGFTAVVLILTFLMLTSLPAAAQTRKPRTQTAQVQITKFGYEPGSLTLKRGVPAEITFVRTVENTCATEVVFADYGINRALPLNQAVVVSFTPKAGEFSFTCGMNMHRGKLIVR